MAALDVDAEVVPLPIEGALEERRVCVVGLAVDVELAVCLFDRQEDQIRRLGAEFPRSLAGAVLPELGLGDDLGGRRLRHGAERGCGDADRKG